MFSLPHSIELLERTPILLRTWLGGLSENWTSVNEGGDTWSVFDVIGHLIYGEQTDWIPRAEIIMSDRLDKTFEPFDRFAQLELNKGKKMAELLTDFAQERKKSLDRLQSFQLTPTDLKRKGMHPTLGEVTLENLLATWVAHDLTHISQIARIMAKQYENEVGVWKAFLRILQ